MTTPSQTYKKPVFYAPEPLTVAHLMAHLGLMIAKRPEIADWPIHILDLDDGDDVPEEKEDGRECLATTVQIDKFSEKQGWVVSLCAEREARDWSKG